MYMLESRPGLGALVLINKDVSKSSFASKVRNASTIGPKDCFKLTFAQQGHIGYMIRSLNHVFVHDDATTHLVAPISSLKSTAIWHEGGIFVRDHADGPVRQAGRLVLIMEDQDLRRSHVLVSRAKGTQSGI